MLLIDPARFGGAEFFATEVKQLVEYVRSCPRIDGVPEILLPGDPERRLRAKMQGEGVRLDEENWLALVRLGEKLGVSASF